LNKSILQTILPRILMTLQALKNNHFFSAALVKYPFVDVHELDYYSHMTILCNSLKMFQAVTSTRVHALRMFTVMARAIKMKYKVITGLPDTNFILTFPYVLPDLLLASSNLTHTIILFISFGHADCDNAEWVKLWRHSTVCWKFKPISKTQSWFLRQQCQKYARSTTGQTKWLRSLAVIMFNGNVTKRASLNPRFPAHETRKR